MDTTQELEVPQQTRPPEPPLTAEVPSAVARSVTDDVMAPAARTVARHPLAIARRMLQALAEAAPALPPELRPLLGPNGAVIWTATADDTTSTWPGQQGA